MLDSLPGAMDASDAGFDLRIPLRRPAQADAVRQVGQTYELSSSYRTLGAGTDSSSSTSSGRTVMIERVLAVRVTRVELEYDLPRRRQGQERHVAAAGSRVQAARRFALDC
jgi:hypothetical protein